MSADPKVSFIFGTPRKASISDALPNEDPTRLITFDATLSEEHSIEAQLTDHPVEDGSLISDHYRRLPQVITINGVVSNDPLIYLSPKLIDKQVFGLIESSPTRISKGPADIAYDILRNMMESGRTLTVCTTLKDYSNMMITSLRISRDSKNGNVLNSTISLREVRISVLSKSTNIKIPRDDKDKSKESKGLKTKPKASPEESLLISPLKQGLFFITG